jgi:hypothetical protein
MFFFRERCGGQPEWRHRNRHACQHRRAPRVAQLEATLATSATATTVATVTTTTYHPMEQSPSPQDTLRLLGPYTEQR